MLLISRLHDRLRVRAVDELVDGVGQALAGGFDLALERTDISVGHAGRLPTGHPQSPVS